MKYYNLNIEEVIEKLKTNVNGLNDKEVSKRLEKYGYNEILTGKKESNIIKFIKQFKDILIIILIISAIISFILSLINKESFIDSIIILIVVILNAILGFIQELKADKAIDSLKNMQVTNVLVKRNNEIKVINSKELVKGDILVLNAGDKVPADARIISCVSLMVNESSLTGESLPISKDNITLKGNILLSERSNMIYSGTDIVSGKCEAVVCETGMDTEFGLIASHLDKDILEETPLQRKINDISKFLSILILIIIIVIFIIGIIKGMDIKEVILLSISLAVAAIPEGLPAVITIVLSLGMNNMAKKRAIVRKMSSVETLGSTEIICSDKTGTITQNKMTVRELYVNGKICSRNSLEKDNMLLSIMALDNDVCKNSDGYIGDPMEIAIYEVCEEYFDIEDFKNNNERIDEIPFDSDRKMMSIINKNNEGIKLYTKGSFDSIIDRCKYIYEDGKVKKLNEKYIKELKEIEKLESNKAYRVLAYAYREVNEKYTLDNSLEKDLIFVGMTSLIDPPREDVKMSINECKKAHIKPVMITGDGLTTAVSIAKEIGILSSEEEAIEGSDLDNMTFEELTNNVFKYSVYARVSPTNKYDIVNAFKKRGKVVAMTGDGVNDAPALNSADIGVGMGISGTEVSKSVSDIILTDDSFSTIVDAVREGRRIFDNIRNVLVYLLAGNIAEVLVVFIGMIFGLEIFLPIQLLFINLVTDSIPAIALAFEKEDNDIMNREIRKKDSSFFTPFLISKITITSILKFLVISFIFFINYKLYNIDVASTLAFLTLTLSEMIFAYSCRNLKKSVLNKNIFSNSYMNKSMIILSIIVLIIFISPLKSIFKITDLSFIEVIYCFIIVLIVFLIDELSKKIIVKLFKD